MIFKYHSGEKFSKLAHQHSTMCEQGCQSSQLHSEVRKAESLFLSRQFAATHDECIQILTHLSSTPLRSVNQRISSSSPSFSSSLLPRLSHTCTSDSDGTGQREKCYCVRVIAILIQSQYELKIRDDACHDQLSFIEHFYGGWKPVPAPLVCLCLQMLAAGHEWASAEILLENYLEGVKSRMCQSCKLSPKGAIETEDFNRPCPSTCPLSSVVLRLEHFRTIEVYVMQVLTQRHQGEESDVLLRKVQQVMEEFLGVPTGIRLELISKFRSYLSSTVTGVSHQMLPPLFQDTPSTSTSDPTTTSTHTSASSSSLSKSEMPTTSMPRATSQVKKSRQRTGKRSPLQNLLDRVKRLRQLLSQRAIATILISVMVMAAGALTAGRLPFTRERVSMLVSSTLAVLRSSIQFR